jgi:nicotinamidase-related amidase
MTSFAFDCVALALLIPACVAAAGEPASTADKTLKPALLVIDVQNEFTPYMSELDVKQAPNMINAAIWLFREHGLPVIRVYHADLKWGPAPDSPGFQFLPSITVKDEDPKIVKNYPSAFKKTDLDKLLREKGCNTLFLCGLSATGCVLATYHGAQDLDYKVFMVKDALISPDATHTNVVEDFCDTVNFTALQVMLESIQP